MTPFNPQLIVDRLLDQTQCFRHIDTVPGVDSIALLPELKTPGAYVLYPEETRISEGPSGPRQFAVSVRVGIVIVVQWSPDRRGAKSPPGHDLYPLINQVRLAMSGWIAPDPAHKLASPIFDSGGIGLENDSILGWVDYWKFPHALCK